MLALWWVPSGRLGLLVVVPIVFQFAVYVVANANHRFRVPMLPLLAIPVGPFLVGARARDRRVLRMVGAALCLLVFASVVGTWALRPDLRPTAPAAD